MNKATPAPESAEPLKFKNAALLNRLFEMTKAPYYATACDTLVLAEMAIVGLERENAALRAEFERLADQAEPAPAPSREVRLLTSKDIDDVRKTLWRDAQMNLSDLHAEDAAKAFQCKFCEVNGLTVKEQS